MNDRNPKSSTETPETSKTLDEYVSALP